MTETVKAVTECSMMCGCVSTYSTKDTVDRCCDLIMERELQRAIRSRGADLRHHVLDWTFGSPVNRVGYYLSH